MKKVFASLLFGATFVAGTANAVDFSESRYPFPEKAVSLVQQNLVVEQKDSSESAYPSIRMRSTANRADVLRALAVYKAAHPIDEYRGN